MTYKSWRSLPAVSLLIAAYWDDLWLVSGETKHLRIKHVSLKLQKLHQRTIRRLWLKHKGQPHACENLQVMARLHPPIFPKILHSRQIHKTVATLTQYSNSCSINTVYSILRPLAYLTRWRSNNTQTFYGHCAHTSAGIFAGPGAKFTTFSGFLAAILKSTATEQKVLKSIWFDAIENKE